MNEKFNENAKVEKFTTMLGIAVRLIVKDPFLIFKIHKFPLYITCHSHYFTLSGIQ